MVELGMQLQWDEHFLEIVVPAWQDYLGAETNLSSAINGGTDILKRAARYRALRFGGAASFYVHHFAEIVQRARPDWLPHTVTDLGTIRTWVAGHCTALRSDTLVTDMKLIHDVADALKHAELTLKPERRLVSANDAVLVSRAGYGGGDYGEGKYGGAEQVLILSKGGPRALSGVLQNVIDAWRRAAGLPLPEIGES